MEATTVVLVISAVFLGSLTRSVFGFGDSVIAMPLLALLPLSLHTSISLIGLVGFTVAVLHILSGGRKQLDLGKLLVLSLGTIIGIPVGLFVVNLVPQSLVTFLLGGFLFFYALYSLFKQRFHLELPDHWKHNSALALSFGFMSGMLGSAYNMNGIPIVIYGTFQDWSLDLFQGMLQSHFILSSSFIVIGQAVGGLWSLDLFWLYLISLPFIFLAIKIGKRIRKSIPAHRFETVLYLFILFLGIMLSTNANG